MKHQTTFPHEASAVPPIPPSSNVTIATATLELLAEWKAQDATTAPEKISEADKEVAEFKKAMNENRAATGARLLFPRAAFSFSIQARSAF